MSNFLPIYKKQILKIIFKYIPKDNCAIFLFGSLARNKTTHVYSEEEAKKIYDFIKEKAANAFDTAKKELRRSRLFLSTFP